MDVNVLQRQFARIGDRAQVRWLDGRRVRGPVALDIGRDRFGELFDIQMSNDAPADVEVLHLEPKQRHQRDAKNASDSADDQHAFAVRQHVGFDALKGNGGHDFALGRGRSDQLQKRWKERDRERNREQQAEAGDRAQLRDAGIACGHKGEKAGGDRCGQAGDL